MKNRRFKKNILIIVLFVIILFVPSIIYWICGDKFKQDVSMAKKSLTEKYESKFREGPFLAISDFFTPRWYKEKQARYKEYQKKWDELLEGVPQPPTNLPYLAPSNSGLILFGRDNWLFTNDSNAIDYYIGNNVLTIEQMEEWKNKFETLKALCDKRGVKLAVMTCPNKEQVYPEHMASYQIETPYKRHILFEKYMHDNSTVNYFYPIRELAAPKADYDTYWQTDTHWNEAGALIGVELIYPAFDMKLDKSKVTMMVEPTSGGDLSNILKMNVTYTNYLISYKPDISYEKKIWTQTGDIESYEITYTSSNKNKKRLVIVGDSYRVAPAHIMAKDFEITEVMHKMMLYYYGDAHAIETINSLKEGDCLLVIGVERFDTETITATDYINNLLAK